MFKRHPASVAGCRGDPLNHSSNPHRKTGVTMLVLAWLAIFGVAYGFFSGWYEGPSRTEMVSVSASGAGRLIMDQDRGGHYLARGAINEVPVVFLVDTGATQVALSGSLAQRLDLPAGPAVTVQTANGPASGYLTRLKSVRAGPIEVHDVSAVVAPGMQGDTVLLGMSFLKHVVFSQRDGQLILEAPPKAEGDGRGDGGN